MKNKRLSLVNWQVTKLVYKMPTFVALQSYETKELFCRDPGGPFQGPNEKLQADKIGS